MAVASQALIGNFKGSTACDPKVGVELQITEAAGDYRALQVKANFKTFDLPGQPAVLALQTPVKGEYDLQTGILSLDSYFEKETQGFTAFGGQVTRSMSGLEQWIRARGEPAKEMLAKASQMSLILGRDTSGMAVAGTIDNVALKCSQLSVARDDHAGSVALIPVSAAVAQKQADSLSNAAARSYWLKLAADNGNREAAGNLGNALTTGGGGGGVVDLAAAVRYLSVAAESGDARAQSTLSYLHTEGLGTPRNLDEGERWRLAADKTRLEAAKVCTAAATLAQITELTKAVLADPFARLNDFFDRGDRAQHAEALVVRARVSQVSFLDRPFECQMVLYLIDPKTVKIPTRFDTVVRNPDGSLVKVDNIAERQIVEYRRRGAPGIFSREPMVHNFQVQPEGSQQFKLTLVRSQTLHSREYSFLVEAPLERAATSRSVP